MALRAREAERCQQGIGQRRKVRMRAVAGDDQRQAQRQRFGRGQVEALAAGRQHHRLRAAVQGQQAGIVERRFVDHHPWRPRAPGRKLAQLVGDAVVRVGEGLDVQLHRIVAVEGVEVGAQQDVRALALEHRRHVQEAEGLAGLRLQRAQGALVGAYQVVDAERHHEHRNAAAGVDQGPAHELRRHQHAVEAGVQARDGVGGNGCFFPEKR